LAETAQEILEHINTHHADALLPIARRFTGEAATEASITAVDRLGFHLRIKTADGFHGRRVAFPREVRNKDEARTAFVEMLREAHAAGLA
jgi:putative heme iron utilization protein